MSCGFPKYSSHLGLLWLPTNVRTRLWSLFLFQNLQTMSHFFLFSDSQPKIPELIWVCSQARSFTSSIGFFFTHIQYFDRIMIQSSLKNKWWFTYHCKLYGQNKCFLKTISHYGFGRRARQVIVYYEFFFNPPYSDKTAYPRSDTHNTTDCSFNKIT